MYNGTPDNGNQQGSQFPQQSYNWNGQGMNANGNQNGSAGYQGYAQSQQNGYQNSPYNGYQQSYGQPQQNDYQNSPYNGYQQSYGQPQQNGYQSAPYNGYQSGYGQPQAGYQQPGSDSYQSGYGSQNNGYRQPYDSYQVGYDTQQGYGQQQMNGYPPVNQYPYQVDGVPQNDPTQAPVQQPQKPPREPIDVDQVTRMALFISLPLLLIMFIAGMVLGTVLWVKWLFVALAFCVLSVMWIRPLLVQSDVRLTLTCVIGALTLVTLVSAITTTAVQAANSKPAPTAAATPTPASQTMQISYDGTITSPGEENLNNMNAWVEVTAAPTQANNTAADSGLSSAAVQQMQTFLYFWAVNDIDSMVALCAPSWVNAQENPKVALFAILTNRKPIEYEATAISGTDNDLTRTITTTITLDRNNGTAVQKYIFKVVTVKENDNWYVDPRSLESNEKATATPASAEITQPPTPAPAADDNVLLYYNPNGGTLYHIDANCKSTHEKYLPFKGSFTYGQRNDSPFNALTPCNICGAPLR